MSQQGFSMSEGFSTYGRITTYIGTAIATIVCLVVIYMGIKSINTPDVYTKKAKATITKVANCDGNSSSDCTLYITYSVDSNSTPLPTPIETTLNINTNAKYSVNQVIWIKYNPSDFKDIKLDGLSNQASGWLMIGISIFILIGVWVWTYFVATNSSFSSIVGGVNAIGAVTRR